VGCQNLLLLLLLLLARPPAAALPFPWLPLGASAAAPSVQASAPALPDVQVMRPQALLLLLLLC
jgi:hypothetical protein